MGAAEAIESRTPLASKSLSPSAEQVMNARGAKVAMISGKSNGILDASLWKTLAMRGM